MAYRTKRGRGGGRGRTGYGGDYRRQTGADSPNWRNHPEPTSSSRSAGVANSPPAPDSKPVDDSSMAVKYADYLHKEWNEVMQLLNQGKAEWLNCDPSCETKREPVATPH